MLPNVDTVRFNSLCVGCGVCQGTCPRKAIRMMLVEDDVFVPEVSEKRCNHCGQCIRVCPGWQVNYDELNMFVFGKTSEDLLLGNCSDCYVGHATSDSVRRKASSGGIVTALLVFALKKHIIDGVIVTVSGLHGDLEPQAIIARSEEELLASSGSKYCPVPIGTMIPQIMSHEGKFAVVGLPCHFHGIRKAEMLNETFRKRIVLHVGLFCSNLTSFEGTTCLLRKMKVDRNSVESLSYRRHGWPGEMSVSLKNGEQKKIPYERYWDCFFGNHFFTPWRCLFCTDATNELADISIGDPWLPQFKNQKMGKSLIVLRTQEAADLLRKCSAEGDIIMFPVEREHVKYSQLLTLKSKKRAVATRISLVRKFGHTVPNIFPPPVSGGVGSILSSVITLTAKKLASHKSFLSILERTPFFILKMHFDLLCAALLVTWLIRTTEGALSLQEVLIIHVGSVTNKGTLALVKAQSSELRRIFRAVRIAASTCDVEEFKALVPDVTPVSLLIDIPHEKADINARNQKIDRDSHLYKLLLIAYSIRMLLEIPVCLMSSLIYHLGFKGTYKSSVISYIAGSDLIISTADENFKEGASELPYNIYWRFVSWTTLLSRTLEVLISKHVFKKSIIVFPNSIGPFRTLAGRFLGKLIFNNIDLLLLRERYSLEWVKKLSLKTPTIVTSDIALLNDIPKPHTTNPDEDYKPLLAVCPGIYAAALSQTQQNNYLTAHVRALDEFIDEYGVRVIFLPLEITGRKNDDYSFCKSILEKMRNSAFAEIVKTKSLEDFCARVSQTELMLSSRMHPTVIASSCRVPVVVITYDYKQLGLMEQLGLDRYVIDVNKVTYENMISTMEKAWKNRRFIREHLELQIPILQDLVRDKIAAACNPYRRR